MTLKPIVVSNSQSTISYEAIKVLQGSIIVSVQASAGEPLNSPEHLCALALSAINGGAKGLRLEGVDNIALVRKSLRKRNTSLPIVGLVKLPSSSETDLLKAVYITPTFFEAKAVAQAGADIIALDATGRRRPDGSNIYQLIQRIHLELGKPVWADVSTVAEGIQAASAGADVIATTLSGYTEETHDLSKVGPDLELLGALCHALASPVVLEGKVWLPEEVKQAFVLGAYAVVIGSAITRPQLITQRFVQVIPKLD